MPKNTNISYKKLLKSYFSDWLTLILVGAICLGLEFIPPFERFYFIDDQSISYPLKPETVPTWMLIIFSFGIPLVAILILSFTYRRTRFETHHALLALLLALGVTVLVTSAIKIAAGRLRPNFLARCSPEDKTNNAKCTGDPKVIKEGRKSFPSGHSSNSFAGLGFLSLYLAGKFRAYDGNGFAWKFFMILVPLMGASLIAISRVDDYYHHWEDVTIGALLGLGVAYLSYSLYFVPLTSKHAGEPNLKRIELDEDAVSPLNSDPELGRGSPNS